MRQSKINPMILPKKLLPSRAKSLRIGNKSLRIGTTKISRRNFLLQRKRRRIRRFGRRPASKYKLYRSSIRRK